MPWVGIPEFNAALKRIGDKADLASREVVAKSAALLIRNAQHNFAGSHKKGQPHVGGDLPNVVTGDLRRSIKMDPVTRLGPTSYVTRVGPRMIYGRRVELGYTGGTGPGQQASRAYPYFEPALASSMVDFSSIAKSAWAKAWRI